VRQGLTRSQQVRTPLSFSSAAVRRSLTPCPPHRPRSALDQLSLDPYYNAQPARMSSGRMHRPRQDWRQTETRRTATSPHRLRLSPLHLPLPTPAASPFVAPRRTATAPALASPPRITPIARRPHPAPLPGPPPLLLLRHLLLLVHPLPVRASLTLAKGGEKGRTWSIRSTSRRTCTRSSG
jgi:hypothetical protein